MLRTSILALALLAACARTPSTAVGATESDSARVARLLSALSDDSLEGRATGSPGSAKAARIIAARMKEAGLEPAGDSGYFQRVPLVLGQGRRGPAPTL